MKLLNSTLLSAIGLATMFVTTIPESAQAGRCGYVANTVRNQAAKTRKEVVDQHAKTQNAIEKAAREIIDGLKGQSRETSNFQQMQVEAAQRIQDGAEVNATKRLKENFRAKAESGDFDPNPFSCILLDLFGNGGGGGGSGASGAISQDVSGYIGGQHPAVQQNGVALSKFVVEEAEKFKGYRGSPNAAADWSLMVKEPTVDLSNPQNAELAKIMMRNMVDAQPKAAPSPEELLTPAGLDKMAEFQETLTRQNAAIEVMAMALNMRDTQMRGAAVQELEKRAKETAYNRPIDPNGISELQQLDIRTVYHYAPTGDRAKKLGASSTMNEKAWLAELHRLLALQTRMTYLQLELMNRDAIVNAGILTTLNDKE
jgi:hypothetical protein